MVLVVGDTNAIGFFRKILKFLAYCLPDFADYLTNANLFESLYPYLLDSLAVSREKLFVIRISPCNLEGYKCYYSLKSRR
jgi:hypothetical protein